MMAVPLRLLFYFELKVADTVLIFFSSTVSIVIEEFVRYSEGSTKQQIANQRPFKMRDHSRSFLSPL